MAGRLGRAKVSTRLLLLVLAAVIGMATIAVMGALQARSTIEEEQRSQAKVAVESALGVIAHYGELEASGTMTREAAQAAAAAAIREMRYSGEEYFWINDMGPTMVMHPIKPELDGTDLSANADPNGKKLFVEFVQTVEAQGSGFVDYLWPKPGEEEPQPKVSYVTGYEQHWDQLFAASVIAIVPVAILFTLIEKHLVGGLTAGSVK